MAGSAHPEALAARNRLVAQGWIARKAESFRHVPPPAAALWLGDGSVAPPVAPDDGWVPRILPGSQPDAVEARWFDLTDPGQRAELLAPLPAPGDDEAAPFAWAHRALVRHGLRLRVGAGASALLRLDRRPGDAPEAPLLVIELAAGARCVLLESHADQQAAQNLQVHVRLASGADLQHLRHVAPAAAAHVAHHVHVRLEADARYAQSLLAGGSGYHLQRSVLDLQGVGAAARLGCVLLASGTALDRQVLARHAAVRTRSAVDLLALAGGAARVVGNVHTHIGAGCDDADVRQRLAGIPTAGQPRIVLRPHLEILHDQVQAAHGATWGALPEEALFHARQRGLDEAAAKALILEGLARAALARGVDDALLPDALRLDAALAAAVAHHLAPAPEDAHG